MAKDVAICRQWFICVEEEKKRLRIGRNLMKDIKWEAAEDKWFFMARNGKNLGSWHSWEFYDLRCSGANAVNSDAAAIISLTLPNGTAQVAMLVTSVIPSWNILFTLCPILCILFLPCYSLVNTQLAVYLSSQNESVNRKWWQINLGFVFCFFYGSG